MTRRPTQPHRHRWEEELRVIEAYDTRLLFFCPLCKRRKERTLSRRGYDHK
jgi:hypothetical protein